MRIAIDAGKALAPRDGIGRYARELLHALAALDHDDEIELFGLPDRLDEQDARRQLGGLPKRFRLRDPATVSWQAIDVLHATTWDVPAGYHGPLLFTCYDLTFLSHPASHTLGNKVHCLTGLLRARLAEATFLAISRATAEDLHQQLGVPEEGIHVVYPAPPSHLQPIETAEARRRLQESHGVDGAPILTVGTLEPRKNLPRLLEAYAGLDAGLRQAHPLVIAGGGGWKNREILDRCGEIDQVHLTGHVADSELAVLYSAAEIFAYPSLAEGFGLPVVEAMTCGAPVLTSTTPALREVAGDAAKRVDPLDVTAIREGLAELLTSPTERERLRALGHARAERFSWNEAARKTRDLYRLLVPSASSEA